MKPNLLKTVLKSLKISLEQYVWIISKIKKIAFKLCDFNLLQMLLLFAYY